MIGPQFPGPAVVLLALSDAFHRLAMVAAAAARVVPKPKWFAPGPPIYIMEWWMLGTMLVLSLLVPTRSQLLRRINAGLEAIARRRRTAILIVIATVAIGRLAMMPELGIPKPAIADEFGYLLTADTFVHGRLTNPTMPMWKSFQTFHEFQVPTYQSQYPVGSPAVLALAQWVFHEPWWAIFIVTALMCGALTWMLQAWLPPYWAFMGGMFAALRFGIFGYWMNSFWGGSLAALGGCLVYGAVPRIVPKLARWYAHRNTSLLRNGILLAIGVITLATTRPFEGCIVCLVPAAVLLYWLVRQRGRELRVAFAQVALPCVLTLAATAGFVLFYQYRVTGHALEAPYAVAMQQYEVSQPFMFQKDAPIPHYDFIELRWIYVQWEAINGDRFGDFLGFLNAQRERANVYWLFYVAPLMTLPLLWIPSTFRDRKLRLIWITLLILAGGVIVERWIQPHYLAPALCLYVLVLMQAIRHLRHWKMRHFDVGMRIVRVLPALCLLMVGMRMFAFPENLYDDDTNLHVPPNWAYSTWRLTDRERIETELNATPGQHLVLVRYRLPYHNAHHEIVYNYADIDGAKILWARSWTPQQNCELVHAYAGRDLWVVDNWGPVYRLLHETAPQICDPRNPVYEPNKPPPNVDEDLEQAGADTHGATGTRPAALREKAPAAGESGEPK